jgi:hypothetical protein
MHRPLPLTCGPECVIAIVSTLTLPFYHLVVRNRRKALERGL